MKKILALAFAAISFAACNDDGDTATTTTDSTSLTTTGTTTDTGAYGDTTGALNTTTTNQAYQPAEGDVTYEQKKVRVRRNNAWVDADEDVKLDNNVTVYRDGRVSRDGKDIMIEEGEVVDRTGNFFDRAGNRIENVWDDTKRLAKNAGKKVKKGAEKVGEKVEKAVTDDDNQ